jgi:pyruvate carboxylase subunit B
MRWYVTIAERTVVVDLGPDGLLVDGEPHVADLESVGEGPVRSLLLDGASHRIVARRGAERDRWDVQVGGRRLAATIVDERTRAIREMIGTAGPAAGPKPVRAPMPGLVVRVEVAVGDVVEPGQGLVIVEAMKMENELRAETGGRVAAVRVAAGEAVAKDQVLIEFEPPRAEG